MDFIIGLPKLNVNNVIMVVIDRLTKYAHFCALSHLFSASIVAEAFINIVQKLHGIAKVIVSDRDPIFTGQFWTKIYKSPTKKLIMYCESLFNLLSFKKYHKKLYKNTKTLEHDVFNMSTSFFL